MYPAPSSPSPPTCSLLQYEIHLRPLSPMFPYLHSFFTLWDLNQLYFENCSKTCYRKPILEGPDIRYVCMAVYLTIYTFFNLLFILWKFCSTRKSTTENVFFGVLTIDPLISANIPSLLVMKIRRHAPGHCACRCLVSSLRRSLHPLQIRINSFHHKSTPL